MVNGRAINMSGYSDIMSMPAQNKGKTCGSAYLGVTGISSFNSGNRYYYAVGLVLYRQGGEVKVAVTAPIAATYNNPNYTTAASGPRTAPRAA